jgi:hypothetical protein
MQRRRFLAYLGAAAAAPIGVLDAANAPSAARRGLICTAPDGYGNQLCEAGIESAILDVTASETQYASQWCWAACIQGVFAYYGHPVSQERIVEFAWGRIVNLPGSPGQILSSINRRWQDDDGAYFRANGTTIGTNAVTAAQDLANDRPLIIGTLGHAMVLSSLTYVRDVYGRGQVQLAEVRDPWPYNPRHRALTPQEWYSIQFAARIRVTSL